MATIETILSEAIANIDKCGPPTRPGEVMQDCDAWFQVNQRLPRNVFVMMCADDYDQAEVVVNGERVGWLRFEFHNVRFVWTPAVMVVDPAAVRSWALGVAGPSATEEA